MTNTVILQGDTAASDGLVQVAKDIDKAHKARAQGTKHLDVGPVDWSTLRVVGVMAYPKTGSWEDGAPKKEPYLRWTIEVPVKTTTGWLNA